MTLHAMIGLIFAILATSASATSAQTPEVIYVDASADQAPHDGSSWCQAYLTVSEALVAAEADATITTIRVADGVYVPTVRSDPDTPRTETFQLINGVSLEGGYAGCGATDPDERDIALYETVLSGDLNGDDQPGWLYRNDNSYHVVTGSGTDATAVIDGFTITGGNADWYNAQARGGGMYSESGSPTVTNCTFQENVGDFGGGMYNESSSPTVSDCVFSGNWAAYPGETYYGNGGGMHNNESNPTVTDCTFTKNWAGYNGGGMYSDESSPTVVNCVFRGNSADWSGGGMWHYQGAATVTDCAFGDNSARVAGGGITSKGLDITVTNCKFTGNFAGGGGGMSATGATVTECIFTKNHAGSGGGINATDAEVADCTFRRNWAGRGGGAYNESRSTLTNCTFLENSAEASGGGMYNRSSSKPTLADCVITGNSAEGSGGGMYNDTSSKPTLTNCSITENSTEGSGGGMYNSGSSKPTLANCTITGNTAVDDGGAMYNATYSSPTVTNCVVWNNTPYNRRQIFGSATVSYSCVKSGWDGEGNIGELPEHDPRLVDTAGHLAARSPCIDAGSNAAVPDGVLTDLAGHPRFVDDPATADSGLGTPPIVDMGAYEVAEDCNENGVLDIWDIALGTSWDCNSNGTPDECEPNEDCNTNGTQDICDIAADTSDDCDANGVPDECETAIIYVDRRAGGSNDGSTWVDAFNSLQDALTAADSRVAEIRVAQGTYEPGDSRTDTFLLSHCVAITGGYRGLCGDGDPNDRNIAEFATILSGDLNGDDNPDDLPGGPSFAENSFHVVTGSGTDGTAVLGGFTITGGNANGDDEDDSRGGGMYSKFGSPTVLECVFDRNSAEQGGAMYNELGDPTVSDCVFERNRAAHGGGIYNATSSPIVCESVFHDNSVTGCGGGMRNGAGSPMVTGCAFEDNNSADDGGGMCNIHGTPVVTDCTFNDNSSVGDGGGIYNRFSYPQVEGCVIGGNQAAQGGGMGSFGGYAKIAKCTFLANSATNNGGGMHNEYGAGARVADCTFRGNSAETLGGGMYNNESNPHIVNSVFTGNTASYGGGLFEEQSERTEMVNCTIAGNLAGQLGGGLVSSGMYPELASCIVWGNIAPDSAQIFGSADVWYSCVDGGRDGNGNIGELPEHNPLFVDADGEDGLFGTPDDDLHLRKGSPCIDAGANSGLNYYYVDTDIAGAPRFMDDPNTVDSGRGTPPIVDMGAYEYWEDCNENGVPDTTDLAEGTSLDCNTNNIPDECEPDEDCNSNGIQDICDVAAGTSEDCNVNDVPDECEPDEDCNSNGIQDVCDVAAGTSEDCNINDVPDECEGIVIYVDGTAKGLADGLSWDNAYDNLQQALAAADSLIAEIRVAQGTYYPGNSRFDTFRLRNCVEIRGGYRGSGEGNPDDRNITAFATILSGDLNGDDDPGGFPEGPSYAENSYHVVSGSEVDATAVLDGVTITGGNADGNDVAGCGGGMHSACGYPKLTDCTFTKNSAERGGGMHNLESGPAISRCTLSHNWARVAGGGMHNSASSPVVVDCAFNQNSAIHPNGISPAAGGGMYNSESSPTVTGCLFTGNTTDWKGGGMVNSNSSSPIVNNCLFSGNSAEASGGGMFNFKSAPIVTNCAFSGNAVIKYGGGIFNSIFATPTVANCIFSGNSAESGGAISNRFSDSPTTITNCTISGNTASEYGGGIHNYGDHTALSNCIVWDNVARLGPQISDWSMATVTHSCVDGGWLGQGNIGDMAEHDPLIVMPGFWDDNGTPNDESDDIWVDGDLRLRPSSPCIDAGDNSAVPVGVRTDLDGDPRFMDDPATVDTGSGAPPIVDMGAYEFGEDCNKNGVSDSWDIALGTSDDCNSNGVPDECELEDGTAFDCNGNGVLDECDLASGVAVDCDSNGVPDTCQKDNDEDHNIDACDNCPKDFNPQQDDQDRDEVGDVCDNCPGTFNPDQEDRDGNGFGDLCDAHLDILPGQCPNFVSSLQTGKWVSVAVVGTEAFHVRRIDPSSVTLERLDGDGGIVRAMGEDDLYPPVVEDVAGPTDECICPANSADGVTDLVLQFSSREVLRELKLGPGLSPGEVRLVLRGFTQNGTAFEAIDCAVVDGTLPSKAKRARVTR